MRWRRPAIVTETRFGGVAFHRAWRDLVLLRDIRRFGRTVALFGHPYIATIDFDRMSYVFCKDNKVPGERGRLLAKVTMAPECLGLAPGAERIGDGYVQPDE